MNYLDAHTHLDHYDQSTLPIVLAEITKLRMTTIAVATTPETYQQAMDLAAQNPLIEPCFGIHPWQAHRYVNQLTELQPLIDTSSMLGEIGLDYVWDEYPEHYPAQRTVLRYFLQAAAEQNKIVNLHTKGAEEDIADLLTEYQIKRAIIHWYSGPAEPFQRLIAQGCYFTYGVELLHNPLIADLARITPLDRILSETDGPSGLDWLIGEQGMPHHIVDVVAALAELFQRDAEEMREQIMHNWQRLRHPDLG